MPLTARLSRETLGQSGAADDLPQSADPQHQQGAWRSLVSSRFIIDVASGKKPFREIQQL